MPELPDLRVYLEALERRLHGERLVGVQVHGISWLRTVDPPLASLAGARVGGVRRIGKRIVIALEGERFLVLHLMVAGRLQWRAAGPGDAAPATRARRRPKSELGSLDFERGSLVVTEAGTRKRATLHVVHGEAALAALDPGGIEPLETTRSAFAARLRAANHTVKRALTDPRILAGIGNAYSDEILHRARLSPFKQTRKLSEDEMERLHTATQAVLREWTDRLRAEAGDAFPKRVTAFRPEMAVHGRYREPCPTCGAPVQRIAYAENEANYCARCQTDGKLLADRALSRLLHDDWPRSLEELEERRPTSATAQAAQAARRARRAKRAYWASRASRSNGTPAGSPVRRFDPRSWAGFVPNGIGEVKPNHYLDMAKVAWRNRDELPFAWRILRDGACDGCALGTSGLSDWTLDGTHLCMVRLNLLRLNTMPALDPARLADVAALPAGDNRALRDLGRLPCPMLRRGGEPGFRRIGWDDAMDLAAARVRASDPRRLAFYLTSRGITNEVYYVAQKVARALGTNHVDNAARICHAPSTVALKQSLGVAASTCSYRDWIGADWIVFFGSDVPNNQPVTTKYLYYAKRAGTKIAVVNPLREPGLERYWIPSVFESAVFGTRLADDFFPVHTGGDRAFVTGVLKALIGLGGLDEPFLAAHTSGFDAVREQAEASDWETLELHAGATRADMERFADRYRNARSAIFVWSMGITQHVEGVDNVQAIVNLALARGMLGRPHCGLMPIRGHSGVQGGAEVGAVPNQYPGGVPVDPAGARRMQSLWGFPVPDWPGLDAGQMVEAGGAGDLDLLWCVGGNFVETLPDPDHVRAALARVPLRVHQDLVVSPTMLVDPAPDGAVLLLPATTRYEQPGGGTQTSTERRIVFSPEIPGRRIGEARSEWQVLVELLRRVDPDRGAQAGFDDAAAIRAEIARVVPAYAGIETLRAKGDQVQWGGPRLCEGAGGPEFPTRDGRAHAAPVPLATELVADDAGSPPPGRFRLSTRRGKQFNSMLWDARDPLTGARRDEVLMSADDVAALGLREGQPVLLRSEVGSLAVRVRTAPIRPRNLQVHWPEGNALIRRGHVDPRCGEPDYNAFVEVIAR